MSTTCSAVRRPTSDSDHPAGGAPAALADLLDASPLARRAAGRIRRAATRSRSGASDWAGAGAEDWPLTAAALVLADPEIRGALRAAGVAEALSARHQPVRLAADSDVVVCSCTRRIAFVACPDAQLLRGVG